jgi:Ca2+/H+ antiporter
MPRSAWIFPALAVTLFAATTALGFTFTPSPSGLVFAAALLVILFGTVFAAVHHAEVIADRIGEPYGTLLLTLAVTIIEVALIATIMLGEKPVPTLARDTVFAVVMIVCNGLVGICIMAGGLRYREQDVQVAGSNLYLSVLIVLATITLILPNYTLTTRGRSTRRRSSASSVSSPSFSMACFSIPKPSCIGATSSTKSPAMRRTGYRLRIGCSPQASCCCWFRCWRSCCWRKNSHSWWMSAPR